jgi:hypothetical protein
MQFDTTIRSNIAEGADVHIDFSVGQHSSFPTRVSVSALIPLNSHNGYSSRSQSNALPPFAVVEGDGPVHADDNSTSRMSARGTVSEYMGIASV